MCSSDLLADQRVGPLEVEVVGDEDQRTGLDLGVERTGGVGRDHHFGAEKTCQANWRHDLFRPIALIEMKSTVEHHQGLILATPQSKALPMPHQRVEGKLQYLVEIDLLRSTPPRDLEAESRTGNQDTADFPRLVPIPKFLGNRSHAIRCQFNAHGLEASTHGIRNEELGIRNDRPLTLDQF